MADVFVGEKGKLLPLPPERTWREERMFPFNTLVIEGIEKHANERGDWRNWSRNHLAHRLVEEVGELFGAIADDNVDLVIHEAPHVAALAMMVWDVQSAALAQGEPEAEMKRPTKLVP